MVVCNVHKAMDIPEQHKDSSQYHKYRINHLRNIKRNDCHKKKNRDLK